MGSKEIISKSVKSGKGLFITGLIIIVLFVLLALLALIVGAPELAVAVVMFIAFGAILFFSGLDRKKGTECRFLKKHPELVSLLGSFDENIIVDNDFVIVSDKALLSKRPMKLKEIVDLSKVLGIYEFVQTMNGIPTNRSLKLALEDGRDVRIDITMKKKKASQENLMMTIAEHCPNAFVGFNKESQKYIAQKRKEYKAKMKG